MNTATRTLPPVQIHSSAYLVKTLTDLKSKQFTGTVQITIDLPHLQQQRSCYLVFQKGALTFAERYLPSPDQFLTLLSRYLKTGVMESVVQYASRRIQGASIRALLETVIQTRVISWDDVERAIRKRMVILLEQLLPYEGSIHYIDHSDIDIAFGDDHHGIDCTELFQTIQQRQTLWQQYLTAIPSINQVPHIRDTALSKTEHEPTRHHLLKWVDGKTTFADIAEGLDQDPLTLIPLYYRWFNEGLIGFRDSVPSASQHQALPVILSVDDSPIVQTLIRRALCESYEVVSASSAIDAMSILNSRQISLILLDITMPDINGYEFCRTIRKINKFKETPVIMLTAKDSLLDRAKGHLAGSTRYLTKPIDKEMLMATIKEFA